MLFEGLNDTRSMLRTDVLESLDSYTIYVDVPGLSKENIQLSYEDNDFKISVNKSDNREYLFHELDFANSSKVIRLYNIDDENIKANVSNGVLTVNIPKKKKKTITIE